jgi:hypothetical protein
MVTTQPVSVIWSGCDGGDSDEDSEEKNTTEDKKRKQKGEKKHMGDIQSILC